MDLDVSNGLQRCLDRQDVGIGSNRVMVEQKDLPDPAASGELRRILGCGVAVEGAEREPSAVYWASRIRRPTPAQRSRAAG